jgi:hypothetical protein
MEAVGIKPLLHDTFAAVNSRWPINLDVVIGCIVKYVMLCYVMLLVLHLQIIMIMIIIQFNSLLLTLQRREAFKSPLNSNAGGYLTN